MKICKFYKGIFLTKYATNFVYKLIYYILEDNSVNVDIDYIIT